MYVALENLRSLHNIGAIFRTCSYFGVKDVLLVGYSGKRTNTKGNVILHEEIKKASLGTEEHLNILFIKDSHELASFSKDNNLKLIAVEQNAKSIKLNNVAPKSYKDSVLVFGNEVTGVSEETLNNCDLILEIERIGEHNSLNVASACAKVLYKMTVFSE